MKLRRFNRNSRLRRHQTEQRRRSLTWIAVVVIVPLLFLIITAAVVSLALRVVAAAGQDLPNLANQTQVALAETTYIYAADGALLAYLHGVENRTVISGQAIPDVLRHATVAIEDARFYKHNGVDLQGLGRALVRDIQAKKVVEGSSTITMQLVGNLYLDRRDISFTRKIKEMALALQLETTLSKNEILDEYLNTIYYGANAYGVEAAARTYFDKDPKDLTLAEAALLAGLPQAPTAYNPRSHYDANGHLVSAADAAARAQSRRNEVLLKMYQQGFITLGDERAAVAEPIELASVSPYTKVQEPYVVAYVKKQLQDMFGVDAVFNGGLRVETTINPEYQKLATDAISSTLNEKNDPQAALVSIEPNTGYIRAMVSSTDFTSKQFDLTSQSHRQPGSAFKTFCLTAAIEMGIDPYTTTYESQPVSLMYPGAPKPWDVSTFGHNYYGPSTIYQATLRSDNTVYAQLALDVGAARIVDVAHRMGITSYLNPDPGIALGGLTYGVNPLEMASAYGTLADQGMHVQPVIILKVTDATGKVVYQAAPKKNQAISQGVAYEVTNILQHNVMSGTGTKADIGRPAAGKTGTAQNFADAWFVGFTPHLATAVWMGHEEGQIPMTDVHGISVTGGSFPAIMWQKFMNKADRDF
ncbi:MAG TPA: PBP1A family penicillin-binding protein, partial [Thermoleophilia bacterium]